MVQRKGGGCFLCQQSSIEKYWLSQPFDGCAVLQFQDAAFSHYSQLGINGGAHRVRAVLAESATDFLP
ncbi:MAG: hypothetical protein ORN83_11495 [Chthoniobacteraceae bacterium]|nr:hypothetical protein [Chthoniobacteraceae bacterium]